MEHNLLDSGNIEYIFTALQTKYLKTSQNISYGSW